MGSNSWTSFVRVCSVKELVWTWKVIVNEVATNKCPIIKSHPIKVTLLVPLYWTFRLNTFGDHTGYMHVWRKIIHERTRAWTAKATSSITTWFCQFRQVKNSLLFQVPKFGLEKNNLLEYIQYKNWIQRRSVLQIPFSCLQRYKESNLLQQEAMLLFGPEI